MSVLGKATCDQAEFELSEVIGCRLVGVQGNLLQLYGGVWVQLQLDTKMFDVDVVVVDTPTADLIISCDFLHAHECTIGKPSGIMVARALVEPENCAIPLRLLNP